MRFAILCSLRGLGHFTPGLNLAEELRRAGYSCRIDVFESLLSKSNIQQLMQHRRAVQENPRIYSTLAAISSKMPATATHRVDRLLTTWKQEGTSVFILLTGSWLPIVEAYRAECATVRKLRCLHIDSVQSPSWFANPAAKYAHDWLLNDRQLMTIRPWKGTDVHRVRKRVVIHSGGWQVHDLSREVSLLRAAGFTTLANANREFRNEVRPHIELRITGAWLQRLFNRQPLEHWPETEYRRSSRIDSRFQSCQIRMDDLQATCACVVSKPGGASLVESLESATPMIFLEPLAKSESANRDLWIKLGFGLTFEQWQQSGFSLRLLDDCRSRLHFARSQARPYASYLLEVL